MAEEWEQKGTFIGLLQLLFAIRWVLSCPWHRLFWTCSMIFPSMSSVSSSFDNPAESETASLGVQRSPANQLRIIDVGCRVKTRRISEHRERTIRFKSKMSIFRPGLFAGKVALVTGGGTGIGKAIAGELARYHSLTRKGVLRQPNRFLSPSYV